MQKIDHWKCKPKLTTHSFNVLFLETNNNKDYKNLIMQLL